MWKYSGSIVARDGFPYPCMFCDYVADALGTIRLHMSAKHSLYYDWKFYGGVWVMQGGHVFRCPYCLDELRVWESGLEQEHLHLEKCVRYLAAIAMRVV